PAAGRCAARPIVIERAIGRAPSAAARRQRVHIRPRPVVIPELRVPLAKHVVVAGVPPVGVVAGVFKRVWEVDIRQFSRLWRWLGRLGIFSRLLGGIVPSGWRLSRFTPAGRRLRRLAPTGRIGWLCLDWPRT